LWYINCYHYSCFKVLVTIGPSHSLLTFRHHELFEKFGLKKFLRFFTSYSRIFPKSYACNLPSDSIYRYQTGFSNYLRILEWQLQRLSTTATIRCKFVWFFAYILMCVYGFLCKLFGFFFCIIYPLYHIVWDLVYIPYTAIYVPWFNQK